MTKLTFLGTGTSSGIPVIGCDCAVCTSADPRDRRTRTSSVVRYHDKTFLIDTAPELRLQALAVGLRSIDAILMTHAHADHTNGFDDLRRFNELAQRHLPVYASPDTANQLRERFAYAFVDVFPFYGGKPDLVLHEFDGPFDACDERIVPIPVKHGRTDVCGFRFGDLAYITDAKIIAPESVALVRGVDTLVLNALRERPHPTHLSIQEAIDMVEQIQPRVAYLVHLSHDISHVRATELLPPGIHVAYDGLTIQAPD